MAKESLICLYGPSACGKTRLLYAMEEALGDADVLRTSAEVIVSEMTDSLRDAAMTTLRRKYLEVDNLLVDNLWVLESRPVVAEGVCRLLRERHDTGKLTVVASEIPEQDWRGRNVHVAQFLAGGQSVVLG